MPRRPDQKKYLLGDVFCLGTFETRNETQKILSLISSLTFRVPKGGLPDPFRFFFAWGRILPGDVYLRLVRGPVLAESRAC